MSDNIIDKAIRRQDQKNFHKVLRSIGDQYDRVCAENEALKKQIAEFNATDELKRQRAATVSIRKHSLLVMTDKELNDGANFRKEHYQSCKNASTFQYEISGTSVGNVLKIRCPVCGTELDLTDYASW